MGAALGDLLAQLSAPFNTPFPALPWTVALAGLAVYALGFIGGLASEHVIDEAGKHRIVRRAPPAPPPKDSQP